MNNDISKLASLLALTRCPCKVSIDGAFSSEWDIGFIPVQGYYEHRGIGLVSFSEVHSMLINPVIEVRIGRLVKNKIIDKTQEIMELLKANCVSYSVTDEGLVLIE